MSSDPERDGKLSKAATNGSLPLRVRLLSLEALGLGGCGALFQHRLRLGRPRLPDRPLELEHDRLGS